MKYIVLSTAVTDEIHFFNKNKTVNAGGGAGWYAFAGMSLWTDQSFLVSGIGRDFLSLHGDWFYNNNFDTSGLILKADQSPKTIVKYLSDGERTETPLFGIDHYRKIEPMPEDILDHCEDCSGLYVFKNIDNITFWKKLFELKRKFGFKLMWEIAADAASPENLTTIIELIQNIDILSINRSEAMNLFQLNEIEDVLKSLKTLNIPLVFFRKGSEGALIIKGDKIASIPCIKISSVVDPTGAGNSSSGAVLVGYCERESLECIGLMGSISAAYMIGQYGPLKEINKQTRIAAKDILQKKLHKR